MKRLLPIDHINTFFKYFFFKVVFEGVCGSSYTGDIAIDDVTILNTNCLVLPSAAAPPTVPPTPPMPVNCTFETGICNWVNLQGDKFDWTRHRGSTFSSDTGPRHDHTTSSSKGEWDTLICKLHSRSFNEAYKLWIYVTLKCISPCSLIA